MESEFSGMHSPSVSMAATSGLVPPLVELADKVDAGVIKLEEYLEQLNLADGRFARLQQRMVEALAGDQDFELYREGLDEALADAFALLKAGLEQMRGFRPGEGRQPVRMARLLLEKGEQEYLAVLEILEGGQGEGTARQRTLDVWGQLVTEAARAATGQITAQEWAETLAWGEWVLGAHMDGTFRDFQRALSALRTNPGAPLPAQTRVLASLQRLSEFVGLAVGQTAPVSLDSAKESLTL